MSADTDWREWREDAVKRASLCWTHAAGRSISPRDDWEQAVRTHLRPLESAEIMFSGDHQRIVEITAEQLRQRYHQARNKRDELAVQIGTKPSRLRVIHVVPRSGAQDERGHGVLRLNRGRLLAEGQLSLVMVVDKREPVSLSVMLRGTCPRRHRPVFLRYDFDTVQKGAEPVSHFNAHWHFGMNPVEPEAKDDPRLPSLVLDPLEVIDVLIMTYFPGGPEDLES